MPRNLHLIHSIIHEPWFIALDYNIEQLNVIIEGVLNPNLAAEDNSAEFQPQISGKVSIIPITGVLTKYDGACGTLGTQGYGTVIQQAINDRSIDAIVLKIDSPGGQVSGTETLANIIASSPKPIVGFVDDFACSAAYWLLSQCSSIVANSDLATVGSIGVMATYTDYTVANDKKGIKVHKIFAPQSTHKQKISRDLEQGDFSSAESELSVLADQFINTIRTSRPKVEDKHLNGDVFYAKDVVGILVDSIGSLDFAVNDALALSIKNKPKKMPTTTMLAASLGVAAIESIDGSVSLTEEQVTSLESHLAQSESSLTSVTTERDTLTQRLETANAAVTSITAERDALKARVAELEKAPGGKPSLVKPVSDGDESTNNPSSFAAAAASAREIIKQIQ